MDVFEWEDEPDPFDDESSSASSVEPAEKKQEKTNVEALKDDSLRKTVSNDEPPSSFTTHQAKPITATTDLQPSAASEARSPVNSPLRRGRTRHARRQAKEQEAQEQKEKAREENNGISPSKIVRFQDIRNIEEGPHKSDGLSSLLDEDPAKLALNANDNNTESVPIPPRRRRKKRTAATAFAGTGQSQKKKESAKTLGVGVCNNLSPIPPFNSDGTQATATTPQQPVLLQRTLSKELDRKLQRYQREQDLLNPDSEVTVTRKVRGAGIDVYALQDAGSFRMTHDECDHLTSSIINCPKNQIPSRPNMVESVAELAVLLSCVKTRKLLWNGGGIKISSKENPLDGILEVLRHTTQALAEKSSSEKSFMFLTQRLKASNATHRSSLPPTNTLNGQQQNTIVEAYYSGLLLDSLAAIVSFLSLDCTVEKKDSAHHKDAKAAQTFRKVILQHEGSLTGFVHIIRNADPMVSSILEIPIADLSTQAGGATESMNSKVTNQSVAPNGFNNLQHATDGSSVKSHASQSKAGRSADSVHDAGSVSSRSKEDPTVAGRRKRRRRRGGAALESIAEDGSVGVNITARSGRLTPPRSPPRVVFQQQDAGDAKTSLTFTSEDTLDFSPSASPARRRRWNSPSEHMNDVDDGSSMVSCDSTLVKIHEQLGKARAQILLPPELETKQAAKFSASTQQHECQGHRELPLSFGGKDPAGSAALMALKALHTVIEGKVEDDSRSCLDEAEEDSSGNRQDTSFGTPDSSRNQDDVLDDNPLVETNRLLGNSGVIPDLAKALGETLSAIVAEFSHQDSSDSPCRACMQHLLDKFQLLASIVDAACLLYVANSTEFCSTSTEIGEFGARGNGILIGSQVLFLKEWLETRSSMSGKMIHISSGISALLDEVGYSVLQTLVSLTHENPVAVEQLCICYEDEKNGNFWNGIQVIGYILHRAATGSDSASKTAYDARTFCFNTLTNAIRYEPVGDVRRSLAGMNWPQPGRRKGTCRKNLYFLTWLTRWVVGQTKSFQNQILEGSFGGKGSGHTSAQQPPERALNKEEEYQLVVAGNGCALLGSLFVALPKALQGTMEPNEDLGGDDLATVTRQIREMILAELPVDEASGIPAGTMFLKNTLRAFSNHLFITLGALSVALVAPIRKLISELESIQVEVLQ